MKLDRGRADKRKLASALRERLIHNAVLGGSVGGLFGSLSRPYDESPAESALRGAAGGIAGGIASTPFDMMGAGARTLPGRVAPALAGVLAYSIPYSIVRNLGKRKKQQEGF